jgi:DNA (cytosine-5)-methyltransferase 1
MKNTGEKITFIDLFAGAGGLGLGFEQAGAKQLLAVEIDKWAVESHKHNFPSVPVVQEDICRVSNSMIKSLVSERPDLIIGGPPCQGFSHANVVNKDPKDPRNSLFEEFVRFVDVLKPAICLIENVPALLRSKTQSGESVIEVITSEIEKIGYVAHYQILDARNYGVPQKRQRLFIVGLKKDVFSEGLKIYPEKTHGNDNMRDLFSNMKCKDEITLWDAISDLQQHTFDSYDSKASYAENPLNNYQKLMRKGAAQSLTNSEPMRHTSRIIDRFKEIGIGESEGNVSVDNMPKKRGNPSLTSNKKYSQNSRRQSPDQPCNSVVASSHTNFIHPYLHRNFTVRELLRIQSFPDWFELKGKRAVLSKSLSIKKGLLDDIYLDQRMQVGNAVPPLLAKSIAKSLMELIIYQENKNAA